MDRATFHELYEQMPPGVKAELIGGVVHMPSPVGIDHAYQNAPIVALLFQLRGIHPGGRDGG